MSPSEAVNNHKGMNVLGALKGVGEKKGQMM